MRRSRRCALTGGFPPLRICPVKVRTWRCGSDGLEHPPVTRETAGSNPVISAPPLTGCRLKSGWCAVGQLAAHPIPAGQGDSWFEPRRRSGECGVSAEGVHERPFR